MMVINISTTNTNLMQQAANLTRNITKKDTELSAIKLSIDKLTDQLQSFSVGQGQHTTTTLARSNTYRTAGGGQRHERAGRGNARQQQNTKGNTIQYCHSCGVTQNHGSRTCTAPKPGHQVGATFQNMMGGSTNGM
eukprot:11082223-Ditylum_brightwellii.AAC.1